MAMNPTWQPCSLRTSLSETPRVWSRLFIQPDALACGSAEQLVDRDAERLSENVPQGDFDGADCAVQDRAAAPSGMTEHALPQKFDLGGILADEEALVLHDSGDECRFLAGNGAFTEPDESLVRVDLAERPVGSADVDDEGLHGRDFEFERFGLRSRAEASVCAIAAGGKNVLRVTDEGLYQMRGFAQQHLAREYLPRNALR